MTDPQTSDTIDGTAGVGAEGAPEGVEPDTEALTEPSTEKDPGEEPLAPHPEEPLAPNPEEPLAPTPDEPTMPQAEEPSHHAVGIGVIDDEVQR